MIFIKKRSILQKLISCTAQKKSYSRKFGMRGYILPWKRCELQWKEMITLFVFGAVRWFNWWNDLRKRIFHWSCFLAPFKKNLTLGRQSFVSTRRLFVLKGLRSTVKRHYFFYFCLAPLGDTTGWMIFFESRNISFK